MTQIIELPIPEELLRLVDERAKTAGLLREAYIRSVLSKDVNAELSISDILSAFRDQVRDSEVGEHELDELFSEARDEVHRANRQPGIDGH